MSRSASGRTRENARLTRDERAERGRALRATVPRTSHAHFEAGFRRSDPLALLESEDETRVPELLAIRYGRMAVSPFRYFRGAALPMASDLAGTVDSGLTVQSCGDAHLANFGMSGSTERTLVFDINEFDETLPAPWEWDLKRLATSMEVVGRNNDYPSRVRRKIVVATVAEYRRAMREFAGWSALDVWHAQANLASRRERFAPMLGQVESKRVDRTPAKAQFRDHLGALSRFVGLNNGKPKIIAEPPLVVPVDELVEPGTDVVEVAAGLHGLVRAYRRSLEPERRMLFDQYRVVDFARTVVGVGSVGTRSWMVLMLGDEQQDPLFLQAKEAGPSVLEAFTKPSEFDNAGRRVVVGQRLMQATSDIFLGWVRVPSGDDGRRRDFYVRRLRDWKGSAAIETMAPTTMQAYGELCGWTLARAHARSGDRVAIAAYLGSGDAFDHAVREFTVAYADQNERDYATLVEAIKRGRIQAQFDV
jgi:uncharacterized protein (DUF2252 family)